MNLVPELSLACGPVYGRSQPGHVVARGPVATGCNTLIFIRKKTLKALFMEINNYVCCIHAVA
jgi:hypothetical protein